MSTNLFAAAEWLTVRNNHGYGPLPIPQPRDTQISELLRSWMALDAPTRQASARGILPEQRFTLLAYSERMASLAVRTRDEELIILGLVALGVDGWQLGDWRDNALVVALHYDAAQRIASDAASVFEKAAALVPPEPAKFLRSFLQRSAANKSLEAMGYVVGTDGDGFRYQRTW
jgi:hypothetical protein